jgi:hypothetical protein
MLPLGMRRALPDFRAQVIAVDRVERLLRRVCTSLARARIPYAVGGGNAVAAWVARMDEDAVRATKGVDVLIRRRDLLRVRVALEPPGLTLIEVLGVTRFVHRRRPSPKTGVHLLFSGELVRPHYVHQAPDASKSVRSKAGYRVIDLPSLVVMKLQSFRDIDRAHLRDLLDAGLIDGAVTRRVPPDLRHRLAQRRAGEGE